MQNLIDKNDDLFPLFLTARDEILRENTVHWLNQHLKLEDGNYHLDMRPSDCFLYPHALKLGGLKDKKIHPKLVHLWIEDDEQTILSAENEGYNIIHPDIIEEVQTYKILE